MNEERDGPRPTLWWQVFVVAFVVLVAVLLTAIMMLS
jgi:hypothetical protein